MIQIDLLKYNCISGSYVEYNKKKIFSIEDNYELLSNDEKIKVLDFILDILNKERDSYNV